jgi:hypothetical protein
MEKEEQTAGTLFGNGFHWKKEEGDVVGRLIYAFKKSIFH